ncbi:ergothioneine biosynthesis protein EgtB [Terrihabitans sp. B22-R8]|uniref:ergothioneine biosynthesis protein EgtB n=1 Tax=Terrihabitans sp. B22-R8 TaxID=3425128 RepID=UPI00403D456E
MSDVRMEPGLRDAATANDLETRFRKVRAVTEELSLGLHPEDQVVQSMPDCSPTKWHLAHVSWFFETFILVPHRPGYEVLHPQFAFLFNSYYEAAGARHNRFERGLITRPTVAEVGVYRDHVTAAMNSLMDEADEELWTKIAPLVEIGINHEQQHQELMLMDILNLFSCNPLRPAYRPWKPAPARAVEDVSWFDFPGGIFEIGHDGAGFSYDNEGPRHEVLLRPFRLASRPVSNADWIAFIEDGGYGRPDLWLADGWARVKAGEYSAPYYWEKTSEGWEAMTLSGQHRVDPSAPVVHVSYFEADAFARWAGKRLPTEAEWEVAAQDLPKTGNFMGSGLLRPVAAAYEDRPAQMFGDVWEWTASPYTAYPGYRPAPGALGEYNGKFMSGQMVLRGGCCATPDGHIRATYRNFFYPHQRWPFAGLRLVDDS